MLKSKLLHKQPLFHVGYIKTGSTWLQNHIFNKSQLGFNLPGVDSRSVIVSEFITNNEYHFNGNETRKILDDLWQSFNSPELIPVWSDETLLGDPLPKRYNGSDIANKIKSVYPNAKILICIREQRNMAISMYREFIKHGNTLCFKSFIGTGQEKLSFTPVLKPDFLKYSHAVNYYKTLFGDKNVLVMPFEQLKEDKSKFVQDICDFSNTQFSEALALDDSRSNIGMKSGSLAIRRIVNRFIVLSPLTAKRSLSFRIANRIAHISDSIVPNFIHNIFERRMQHLVESRYEGLFTEDNSSLSKSINVDLKMYGYM